MLVIKKLNTTPISFSFKLDQGEVISDNCPNMTVYGAVFNFKTKNGASIIGKNQNVPFTDITYYGSNGLPQIFDTSLALWTALFADGFNDCASGSGGTAGGVDEFTELKDTFTFSGNDGCVPVVNTSLQKLVPVFFNNIDELTQLKDVFIPLLEENNVLITKKIGAKVYVATEPKTPQTLPQGLESVLTVGNASVKKIELTSPETGGVLSLGANETYIQTGINRLDLQADFVQVQDMRGVNKTSWLKPESLRVNTALIESNNDQQSQLITPITGISKRVLVASVNGIYADENGNVVSGGGGGSQNLQQVLDVGNSATKEIVISSIDGDRLGQYADSNVSLLNSSSNVTLLTENLLFVRNDGTASSEYGIEALKIKSTVLPNGKIFINGDRLNLSSATNLMLIEPHKITVADTIKSSSLAPNYLRVNNAIFESNEDAGKPSQLITPSTGSSKRVLVTSVNGNYADENGNVVSGGGGGSQTLQQVLETGNDTTLPIRLIDTSGTLLGGIMPGKATFNDTFRIAYGEYSAGASLVTDVDGLSRMNTDGYFLEKTNSGSSKTSELTIGRLKIDKLTIKPPTDISKESKVIAPSTTNTEKVLALSYDGVYADVNGEIQARTTDTIISIKSTGVALSFLYILPSGIQVGATRTSIGKYMIHAVVGWGNVTIASFSQTNSNGFIFVDNSVLQPLSSLFITTKTFSGALSDDILNGTAFTFTRLTGVDATQIE